MTAHILSEVHEDDRTLAGQSKQKMEQPVSHVPDLEFHHPIRCTGLRCGLKLSISVAIVAIAHLVIASHDFSHFFLAFLVCLRVLFFLDEFVKSL